MISVEDEGETASVMTNPMLRPSAGEWLKDRYELLRVLDDGVFGTTWQARDARTGGLVALKLLGESLVMNDGERREVASKLEMFCGRSLAGCVMPIETVLVPGGVGVVTPLVDGVSLRAVMDARAARGERFTPEECLRVIVALVSALQALHTSSPHGGLRPENVLITTKGVLITDGVLGVSVPPDRIHQRLSRFRPAAMAYSSPELGLGRRPTASADLYALGAMAAELAGGKTPAEGPDLASISRELHRAVATLLDRDPGRRPGGVRMLLDALASAAGFAQLPVEPPLPVPESVLATRLLGDDEPPPVRLPPARPVAKRPHEDHAEDEAASASEEKTSIGPMPLPPSIDEDEEESTDHFRRVVVARPEPPPPITVPDVQGGRISAATASLPLIRPEAAATTSGPPPNLAVRSGPPPTIAPMSVPTAQRAVAPRLGAVERPAPRSAPSRSFDDDDAIDPKLLRAAQILSQGRGRGGRADE